MDPAEPNEPVVDVMMEKRDSLMLIKILVGIPDCLVSSVDTSLAFLYNPFVTFEAGHGPSYHAALSSTNGWKAPWKVIIDPSQPVPTILLSLWRPVLRDEALCFKIDMWEVECNNDTPVGLHTFHQHEGD